MIQALLDALWKNEAKGSCLLRAVKRKETGWRKGGTDWNKIEKRFQKLQKLKYPIAISTIHGLDQRNCYVGNTLEKIFSKL